MRHVSVARRLEMTLQCLAADRVIERDVNVVVDGMYASQQRKRMSSYAADFRCLLRRQYHAPTANKANGIPTMPPTWIQPANSMILCSSDVC